MEGSQRENPNRIAGQAEQAGALSWAVRNAQAALQARRAAEGIGQRPNYGRAAWPWPWPPSQDAPGRAELGQAEQSATAARQNAPQATPQAAQAEQAAEQPLEQAGDGVRLYPDVTIRAHQAGQDAAARLYLLCRDLDRAGSGRVDVAALRTAVEGRGLLTWRRIRQILEQGAGIFWTRGQRRSDGAAVLTLLGPARILRALGGGPMVYRAVLIPRAALWGGMLEYRAAAVYSAALAGRRHDDHPISQAAIREATGAAERTQRDYRAAAGVRAVPQRRILGPVNESTLHNSLYEQNLRHGRGRRVFVHTDARGLLGPAGGRYLMAAAPNRYEHARTRQGRRGRRAKIQTELTSLKKWERGNGARLYWPNYAEAWKAAGRRGLTTFYQMAASGPAAAFWQAARG